MAVLFASCLISTSTLLPGDSESEVLLRSIVEVTQAQVDAVSEVTNEQSAMRVRPRLAALNTQFEEWSKQIASRPERERLTAELRWNDRKKKADEALILAHNRVFSKTKPAYRILASSALFRRIEKSQETRALSQARVLELSCKAFYIRANAWPSSLLDLVKPPDGGRGFLEDGQKAVIDPWGAPFQFVVKQDEKDIERPYVWTITPYGDGKKVLGNYPPESK